MSRDRRKSERGIALVTTVLLALFLALVAATVATAVRTRSLAQSNSADLFAAELAASGALHLALFDLSQSESVRFFSRDGSPRTVFLDGVAMNVSIEDERGKLDLGHAPPEHVRALLRALGSQAGIDAFAAVNLADRLVDLAKAGERPGPTGLWDFTGLPDVTPALIELLERHATVFGLGSRVNASTASRDVLLATGADPRTADEILAARRVGGTRPSAGRAETWLTTVEGPVYTVRVTARLANGISRSKTAVVVNEGASLAFANVRFSIVEIR